MLSQELITVCVVVAQSLYAAPEVSQFNEPFPDPSNEELKKLTDCCLRAEMGYASSFEEKVSRLVYNICRNHYLRNGNKRMALLVLFSVLIKEKFLSADDRTPLNILLNDSYDFFIKIAKSDSNQHEEIIGEIQAFILKLIRV